MPIPRPPLLGTPGFRPPLASIGIEEVAENLVLSTPENRRLLVQHGYTFQLTRELEDPQDDSPTPRMRAYLRIEPEDDVIVRADRLRRNRIDILENPDDPASDYISPLMLLEDPSIGEEVVPFRVKRAARRWQAAVARGQEPLAHGHWPLPQRCRVVKWDGTRCWAWTGTTLTGAEEGLCRAHNVSEEGREAHHAFRAREILLQASVGAAVTLETLAYTAEREEVRLKASTEILDRVGIRGGLDINQTVEVTHLTAADQIRERLERLGRANVELVTPTPTPTDPVVEAELVE